MPSAGSRPHLRIDGPKRAKRTIALAHGAGVGMDSDFMAAFAQGLAKEGIRVVRFEFPFMAERRRTGKSRPPDRGPVLREAWLSVIASLGAKGLSQTIDHALYRALSTRAGGEPASVP